MKSWHLGCLFVLLIGLSGCSEPVYPPSCYHATLSLESPDQLPDMRIETDRSSLTIINTAAYTTTVDLIDLYFTNPRSVALVGQFPGTFRRATPDRLVLNTWDFREVDNQPQYPNCDQPFPATSPAVILVTQPTQRRLVTVHITHHPTDPAEIARYREYEHEGNVRQRMIYVGMAIFCLLWLLGGVGLVWLMIKVFKLIARR
jgi:hypothetical protein